MAKTLSASLNISANGSYVNTTDNLRATTPLALSFAATLTNGDGANQVNLLYDADGSVANGAPVDIDLAGSLADIYGDTAAFSKIKMLFIANETTTAGAILSVGGDTAAWSSPFDAADNVIKVGPGGCLLLFDPSAAAYGVTASTADILQLASASGTINYRIQIWGVASS